ncbi:MAG: hypothetical protein PHX47_00425 [Candidatus ainarchaeum sp.]|nr:hypothetical protein [Candidatus ainarchaeum sp.]
MENIQTTSTVFFYIAKKLKEEFNLGYINNVQTIDNKIWKIKIHSKKTKELIITPEICFLPKHTFPVSEILGFEKYLKKKLYNQRIHAIYQDKNNKVICFKLDKYYLIFEFFSKSNVILTDENLEIITSRQKEEWKDRIIQKGETYNFPSGEDIKLKNKKEIEEELKDLTDIEKIRVLSKKYNVAPMEINDIIDSKKPLIETLYKNYELKEPKVKKIIKNNKNSFIISRDGEDIFNSFENEFKNFFEQKEEVKETIKKNKVSEILKAQEDKKEEFENKIKTLEKEGEFIYSNFTLIDQLNSIIEKATLKKIESKDIILKINNYLEEKNIELYITEINQKKKTYTIEKKIKNK